MKKKKFLSAVLAASLLCSTVPATAWASEASSEPGNEQVGPVEPGDQPNEEGKLIVENGEEGTDYTYSDGVLTLLDGADVTVSSNGTTSDRIVVDGGENVDPAVEASLTLNGVDFKGTEAGILVKWGSSLTLTLEAGSYNSFESERENHAAIEIEHLTSLTIQGTGQLLTKSADGAAAIGGASSYVATSEINITGGNIKAYTGGHASAIGGGDQGASLDINISGGKIFAGFESLGEVAAGGIGGGMGSNLTTINISGGEIEAYGSEYAAIGSGKQGIGDNIVITGGDVVAHAISGGAAIGGSWDSSYIKINISGDDTNVNATATNGVAIGGGNGRDGTTDITISGGNIFAESDMNAGIGGDKIGTINITGGTVEAYGGEGADGIGASKGGIAGTFSTGTGNPVIITNSISDQNSESVWNGVFLVDNMNGGVGKVYGDKVTPTNDFTIPEGKTLEVDAGQSLIVAKGITATNNGTVIRDTKGTVDVQGTWRGNPVVVRGSEEDVAVTGVQLNKRTLTLAPTETETLVATISPEDAANKSLRWSSSDSDVATVDANGKVTAAAEGTAVITVSTVDGGFTAQCTVTVSEDKPEIVAVENVTLNKTSASLEVGETEQLTATVKPADAANKSVRWKSNDENVVSVDANGNLTAISSGMATVTVTTEEGNFTALCKVTVTNPDDTTTDTETQPDGSTVTTVEDVNGSSSSTTVDTNGVSTTTVSLSETVIDQADRNDMAVTLPMVGVTAATDIDAAPSVTVDLPTSGATKVEIPVLDLTPGTVAVLVDENGNETIIPNSVLGNNGLIVTLADGDTVKILDNTQEYNDVAANHWAKGNIDYVTSRGLFVGVDDESFAPETSMTRAMIVSVLQRYAGDTTSASGNWYEGARQWAIANGISDGTNMNGNVTREQLVTMLYRYIGSPQVVGSLADDYSDNASVSPYAEQAMVWAVKSGIIGGMTADTLAPQGLATRAQVAAILERFIAWEQA